MRGGAATGPSPVDRGKTGSKHHVIVEAHGIPLAATLTGGNRNDVTQLIPLIRAVPRSEANAANRCTARSTSTPTAATTTRVTATRSDGSKSPRTSPDAAPGTAPNSAYTAGSWKAPSHYRTGSAAYASAGRSAATCAGPSPHSVVPSSAGDG